MKMGIIQASSQKDKNKLLEDCLKDVVGPNHEVINFGVYSHDSSEYSYIQTALAVSALLESKSVDFIITGCSSGQGMMLACNSLPGVLCGYVTNPSDAYLFGRINNGNAISYPLGLNFGWAAEINLKATLKALFTDSFGAGYPQKDAERKKRDTIMMKQLNQITKKSLTEILPEIDSSLVDSLTSRSFVYDYILSHGTNEKLIKMLKEYSH